MARKRVIKLNNISAIPGAAAAGTAIIAVPLSFGRLHELHMQYGHAAGTNTIAAALAFIDEVRIMVNGDPKRTFSGEELRDQNLLNGTAYDYTGLPNTTVGVNFPMYFAEPWRKDARDQDLLAWSTRGMTSMQLEVQLAANANAPTLNAFAVVSDDDVAGEPLYCKWIRQTFNGGSTDVDITTIERRGFISSISLYPTAALTDVKVNKDGTDIYTLKRTQADALLTNHGMLTVGTTGRIANVWDIVADHDDLLGSAWDMKGSKDLTINLKSGSSLGSTTGIIQRIETL